MRVDIEKRHIDTYENIAKEVNKALKKSASRAKKEKYKKDLLRRDISAENKKKKLTKNLHELIVNTFAIDIRKKVNIERLKADIELIRYIIHKIKCINNYLEEDLLRELGIIKESLIVKALKSGKPEKYLEKSGRVLTKAYIDKIEHTVYQLMEKIVVFDKKLLKNYKKREVKVIGSEKLSIKDIETILRIESELLDTLEAKIPPASKVKMKLFSKKMFSNWVPLIFALLSSFEAEYEKEKLIFLDIKKDDKLRKKIEYKIKYVVTEKEKILKLKQKKALLMKTLGGITDDYRQVFQEYVSAASL